ncbi:hypothetical protein ACFY5D_03555 [Paeniglutamicibacter sp. NPDC012692]|uniref:hypothetical protein n=1 Tax=Paeniglutamicibacter sp. NPDC012692 TaxID=3364388 RepID=UPI00369B719C
MSAQSVRRVYRSPRPVCPDPYCGKVWAPTRDDAKRLRAEIQKENGDRSPVRYYEHAGGWHWTRRIGRSDA